MVGGSSEEIFTVEEVTALLVVFMTLNAVQHKEREHLIPEKTPIIIMEEVPTPLFWTVLSSLDVVQITNASTQVQGLTRAKITHQ